MVRTFHISPLSIYLYLHIYVPQKRRIIFIRILLTLVFLFAVRHLEAYVLIYWSGMPGFWASSSSGVKGDARSEFRHILKASLYSTDQWLNDILPGYRKLGFCPFPLNGLSIDALLLDGLCCYRKKSITSMIFFEVWLLLTFRIQKSYQDMLKYVFFLPVSSQCPLHQIWWVL